MKEHIKSTVKALAQVKMEKARCADHACPPPDRLEIVKVLHELQSLLFPMAFRRDYPDMADETLLIRALYRLRDQLVAAMRFQDLQGGFAEALHGRHRVRERRPGILRAGSLHFLEGHFGKA